MHDNRLNTMVHFAAHLLAISAGVVAGGITNRFLGTSTQLGLVLVILLLVFDVMWKVSKKIYTTTTLDKKSQKKESKKDLFAVCMAGYYLGEWIDDRFYGTDNTRSIFMVIFLRVVIFFVVWWVIEKIEKLIVAFIQKRRQP